MTRDDALARLAARCDKWARGYDLVANDRHEYLTLIARQVKIASRAEQEATRTAALERIAAFAVLALTTDR